MNENDFCKCGHQRHNHWGEKQCSIGTRCKCKKFRLQETFEQFLDRTEQGTADWYKEMEKFGQ